MPPLRGALVVVAGGGGGLGRAVVAELSSRGAQVISGERRPPRDDARVAGADYRTLDALDEAGVSAFFAALPRTPLALVNTIGGYAAGPAVAETEIAELRQQLDVNLLSAALLTKWAVRSMAPAKAGRIVHVSSRAATEHGAHAFAYTVAKLGVVRLVEAAAAENVENGITVNCVLPSIIDTPANRAAMAQADFTRWTRPEQIAKVIAFLVGDDAEVVSGAAIPVYGRA
jgi:NAD(P)-dependent dehydrogenase (short-subunit alcohol dehydrogenase family)